MIIGIDQSLSSSGVVVVNQGKIEYKTTIKTKTEGSDRLEEIYNALKDILGSYKIDLAVMEGYSFLGGGRLATLGEVGGIIKLLMKQQNIPVHVVAPMTLKKFCNSSKAPGKNKVMLEVYKRFDVEFEDDNQTDAFGLAKIGEEIQYYQNNGKYSENLKKYEQEAVKKVIEK